MVLLTLLSWGVFVALFDTVFVWQTTGKLVGLCGNYRNIKADLENESKGKDKDFQDIYKSTESTRKALTIADSKRLAIKRSLADAQAI